VSFTAVLAGHSDKSKSNYWFKPFNGTLMDKVADHKTALTLAENNLLR
jgi:hypothetical protein